MPRFAANLSMMFQDIGFLDRFDAAARAGFKGVEFLFPYDHPPEAIAERLERNRLTLALFNTVPGDWNGGERGLAALPGREQEFRDGVDKAIVYARATKCPLLHTMAGSLAGGARQGRGRTRLYRQSALGRRPGRRRRADLHYRADQHARHPRLFPELHRARRCASSRRVGRPNLRLQLDLYHVQIMEGDLATRMRALAGHYPHVQIAGNPGRHEPDVGEINYPYPVRPVRRTRLFGLDRLRVPAQRRHDRRARLGQEIRDHCLTKVRSHGRLSSRLPLPRAPENRASTR